MNIWFVFWITHSACDINPDLIVTIVPLWLHSARLGGVNTCRDNSGGAVERGGLTLSWPDTRVVRSLPSGGWRKHTAYSPAFITSLGSRNGLSTRHKHLACTSPLAGLHCQPYLYEVVITEPMAINPYCNLGDRANMMSISKVDWLLNLCISVLQSTQFDTSAEETSYCFNDLLCILHSLVWWALPGSSLADNIFFNKCRYLSRIISTHAISRK